MGTLQIRLGIYKTIFKKFCPDFVEISSVKVFFSSPPPAGSWVSHGGIALTIEAGFTQSKGHTLPLRSLSNPKNCYLFIHCKKIIAYTNSYVHLWSTKKDELSSLTEGVNGAVNHICEPFVDCYLVRAASFCRVYPQ